MIHFDGTEAETQERIDAASHPAVVPAGTVIYIMGAGRSGTTLLDIMLGATNSAVSVGEVRKFNELRGRPRRQEDVADRAGFWMNVTERFLRDRPGYDFARMERLARRVEYHSAFPRTLLAEIFGSRSAGRQRYRDYALGVVRSIQAESGARTVVDSSKYPGRALALQRHLPRMFLLLVIRHPAAVVSSFQKAGVEQPRSSPAKATLYYLLTHLMCAVVYLRHPRRRRLAIRYEDAARDPAATVAMIAARTGLDGNSTVAALERGDELPVGALIDGNRFRLKRSLAVRRPDPIALGFLLRGMTVVINGIWYFAIRAVRRPRKRAP